MAMWELGAEPGSSEQQVLLTDEALSLVLVFVSFWKLVHLIGLKF